ncbi:MAG: LytR/AlgR family response regulator transcription factor, partial [Wujia sp.]
CVQAIDTKPNSITIRTASGYQNIYLHQIECVEAQNKKVVFSLSDGSVRETSGTLSSYEEILNCGKGFFKCHRSYLVYIPAVDYFTASEILTKSGLRVPIARGQGKAFEEFYFSCMFKEV